MFVAAFTALVDLSRKYAAAVVIALFLAAFLSGLYASHHLSMNTDVSTLLSEKLAWRQREKALDAAFPQKAENLIVVIDGTEANKVESAAAALTENLKAMPDRFTFVSRPDALPFFHTNGLLYLSKGEMSQALDQIAQAQPMLGAITRDPSLRGFLGTIGLMMQGVQAGELDTAQLARPLKEISKALQAALEGRSYVLDWRNMMPEGGNVNAARELRKVIITKPVLDYSSLLPGAAASKAVRQAAADLHLTPENGVRVRLTGPVPLNDEEFASVAEGAGIATGVCGILVFGLLFLAMRTWRIVLPITLTLIAGLVFTTAFAAFAVGALNLISVAFAVMFIGIAVDFGIQFGVRYRDQHNRIHDHAQALRNTAKIIAAPLAMAAGSTALGFLSFIPTEYRGVSELGLIAGVGMIIAFILNVTLLPALMSLTKPPAESERIGFAFLAPLNSFLATHTKPLLAFMCVITVAGLALATQVCFDFDPLDLKNPKSESASTMFELISDPDSDAYTAQILGSPDEIRDLSATLEKLPEVDHVMTVESFVPEDQDKKLAMIADTSSLLAPTFALDPLPPPTGQENIAAFQKTAALLRQAGANVPDAALLADTLERLAANATPNVLQRAQDNVIAPLQTKMAEIRTLLQAKPVTLNDVPLEITRDWVTSSGQRLLEVFPKRGADNNPRDPVRLSAFLDAVQKIAPSATGTPFSIRESGRAIISAFVHAGIYAFVSIAFLSFLVLRKLRDIVFMLTPLFVAGTLTVGTIKLAGLPLNFANIIALPLLLSLGVSYTVYFVFFAKQGRRDFLQSSMARAVLFSAATVSVAFISLMFSSHPGTQGMGELLTIALLYSLLCTFFFLPVLYNAGKADTLR